MAEIESLMLANHAEAVNGLLYVSGGGWTDLNRGIMPGGGAPATHFGIALSALVPWTQTDQDHPFSIRVEGEDGPDLEVARVEGTLRAGRPTDLPPGSEQRTVLAINADVVFPQPGGYRIIAEMEGTTRTVSFRVRDSAIGEAPPSP